jgi:hypothetical protein
VAIKGFFSKIQVRAEKVYQKMPKSVKKISCFAYYFLVYVFETIVGMATILFVIACVFTLLMWIMMCFSLVPVNGLVFLYPFAGV